MKRKILKAMEDVREELELEHQTKKRIRIEKIKINSKSQKIKKEVKIFKNLLTKKKQYCIITA